MRNRIFAASFASLLLPMSAFGAPVKLGGFLITGGGGVPGLTGDGHALLYIPLGLGLAIFLVLRAIRNRGKKPDA